MKKIHIILCCAALLIGMTGHVSATDAAAGETESPSSPEISAEAMESLSSTDTEDHTNLIYAYLIEQTELAYGPAALASRQYANIMTGLCFAKLIDFDQNGANELVMVYNGSFDASPYSVGYYTYEVWSYADHKASKLETGTLYTTNGGAQSVYFTEYNGKWYLITGSADSFEYDYYHSFGENGFGIVREAIMDENDDGSMSYEIDGVPVSADQWQSEQDAWLEHAESCRMNYLEDASAPLAALAETKAILGMETETSADTASDTSEDTDYILPDSSQEYLTREDLEGLSAQQLLIARNEIFARHGRRFNMPELQQYFESRSWYVPQYTPEEFDAIQYDVLNEMEWANINLISELEAEAPETPAMEETLDTPSTQGIPGTPTMEETPEASAMGKIPEIPAAQEIPTSPGALSDEPEEAVSIPILDPAAMATDDGSVFRTLPSSFTFSSGAGAWATGLNLNPDGTFTGDYHDSDMGDMGDGYPNGTVYVCSFSGSFSAPVKISDFIYSMKLESFETETAPGEITFENGIRYIYSEPYGMENADEFLIYLPGTPVSEIAEEFLTWLFLEPGKTALPADTYGIYNVSAQHGFTGRF